MKADVFDVVLALLLVAFASMAVALALEVQSLRHKLLEAECKFEAIDPIRAEAGVEMSEKCKCFWRDASLEQIRRMK